jgi:hypothetical protein
LRATTVKNTVSACRKCGTHLCDARIFGDHEFIPQYGPQNSGGEVLNLPDADGRISKNSSPRLTGAGPEAVSQCYVHPPSALPATSSTGMKGAQEVLVTSSLHLRNSLTKVGLTL